MSNDNKTLADVQPGGRVRLGNVRDRVMGECEQWFDTSDVDMEAATDSIIAAAQPSPGGQGDALKALDDLAAFCSDDTATVDRHVAVIRAALAARQPVETQLGYTLSDVHEAYSRGKRDAARQPVGEPDAWVPDKFFGPGVNAMTARRKPSDAAIAAHGLYVPLYRHPAPPAQAVDLGQFRPFVEAQRQEYISHGLTPEDYCVAKCDELLALIDGKAVGK
ncbi:hypothetical protein D7Y39_14745 [Stenotrophomonas maltophilia]|uniref:hypothetical protein n=1 Tax=Stenotrophomonas maltophilia TaxID=40324 RepID=UPI0013114C92|nr:hypothetical protein [Stenotrophomonas maltophilia]MBA0291070.1 hypothetical protein [Stenotrophomonas maltophilia]